MADTTAHLALPFIMASQAQKHVTHNEALRMLDGIVQLSVLDRDLTAPPASPTEGARYIPATGATGAWAGWDGSLAYWIDGAWMRILPAPGWLAWAVDEAQALVWTGSAWIPVANAMGFLAQSASVDVARGANDATTGIAVLEQDVVTVSGSFADAVLPIPNRAIVLGVSTRVRVAITGATSFSCGVAGEPDKFGDSLGIAAGSTNNGVIGPTAFYADTSVRLTANGGNFTGGTVRIAIHYLTCGIPA